MTINTTLIASGNGGIKLPAQGSVEGSTAANAGAKTLKKKGKKK